MVNVAKIWMCSSWPEDARILEFVFSFWNSRIFLPVQQVQPGLLKNNLVLNKPCFFRSLIINGRLYKRKSKQTCHRLQIKIKIEYWSPFEHYQKWWDICRTNEKQEKDSMCAEGIRTLPATKGFTNTMPNIIKQTVCKAQGEHLVQNKTASLLKWTETLVFRKQKPNKQTSDVSDT